MPRFQPVTVPVQVIRNPGDFTTPASTTIDPNPGGRRAEARRPAAAGETDAAEEEAEACRGRARRGSPFPTRRAGAQPAR